MVTKIQLVTLFTCALFSLIFGQTFPTIPNTFSMDAEVNFMPQNRTFIWTQNYDYDHQRARMITYNETDTTIHWYFLATKEKFERLPQLHSCKKQTWTRPFFVDPDTELMRSSLELFGSSVGAVYVGPGVARSINCDIWKALPATVNGRTVERLWYFALPTWNMRGLAVHQVPVRIVTTSTSLTNPEDVHHTSYEITNFLADDPFYRREFVLPKSCYEPFPQIALPSLPEQFRTTVSITDVKSNTTTSITEYVDELNERLRVDYHMRNRSMEIYYDVKRGWQYSMDKDNEFSCVAERIHDNSFFFEDGHLMSTQKLFRFGSDQVYDGKEIIRGIECEKWVHNSVSARRIFRNIWILFQYRIVYYFAVPDWSIWTSSAHRIPIRAHITTTALNATRPGFDSEQYMEFTNFHVGNMTGDDDGRTGAWHVPGHCLASFAPIPLPSLSPYFEIDVDISTHGHTFHFKEFYDYYNERVRFETRGPGERNITIYFVDKLQRIDISGSNCHKSAIPENSQITRDGHLRSAASTLHFGQRFPYKYLGRTLVREIDCDRWWLNFTSVEENTWYLVNYYFSAEDWNIDRIGKHRIPIRIEIEGYPLDHGTGNPVRGSRPIAWQYFDYGAYHTMQPPPSTFMEPAACINNVLADSGIALGIFSLSLTGGMIIFALLGFIGAFSVFIIIFKIRSGKSPSINVFPDVTVESIE